MNVINQKQDLSFLKWSHVRSSSGTAGTFLKSESFFHGRKTYYKLSNYDSVKGVIGHECVNEIIVDRLLTLLGVEHLDYELIHAGIEVEGRPLDTYICASEDFKKRGESKIALDDYYRANALPGESHYDFCVRCGWQQTIDRMIAVDYFILNRDRHGANIEILRNPRSKSIRIAPLFDHGLSLIYPCKNDQEALQFDVHADKPCNNFIGSYSCYENLSLIANKNDLFPNHLKEEDKTYLFDGLESVLSDAFLETIWKMIYERYRIYENL